MTNSLQFNEITEYQQKAKIQFIDVLETLGYLGCTYLSVVVEDQHFRKHFFSDSEWLSTFIAEGFMENCQLSTLSRQRDLIIPWDSIFSTDKQAQRVMEARHDHNIAHGITISKKISDTNLMIAFGTHNHNKNFTASLINNPNFLKKTIAQLHQIAS